MRNVILLILIASSLIGCKTKPLFYQGYVYHDNQPQENVTVITDDNNQDYTKTDVTGYFKLNKMPNTLTDLIFNKEGFRIDTIPSVWSQHGEKIKYNFINKKMDTIQLIKISPDKVN